MAEQQITTPGELQWLRSNVGCLVVITDHGPAIVWMGEDEEWHSIRAATEDDPPEEWAQVAVSAGIDLDDDPEDILPLTVVWADGPLDALTEVSRG